MIALVGYYEPWWIQIIKAIVIFAVGLQLVPDRAARRAQAARALPEPLRPQPRRPLRRAAAARRHPQAADQGAVPPDHLGRLPVRARADHLDPHRGRRRSRSSRSATSQDIFGTQVGLYGVDVSIGPLYLFAFGAIAFYGIMLGGWSSGSKYSFLGAMRGAAQLISYEVSQGLALVGVIITAQTLSLTGIVHAQKGMWYFVPQFFGFLIFLVASFAETNRAPFDLTEADAELVGGYNTEYGGGRFASYYFAEYLNVLVVSGIVTTVFLGGWLLPFGIHPPGWVDPFVVLVQDGADHVPVHLGPRDAAAPALRPADELRLEGAAAARHAQRARDRDRRGGDPLMAPRRPERAPRP